MNTLTSATMPVAQVRKELDYLIERGERAKATLAALNLLFPIGDDGSVGDAQHYATATHQYGNGEPDHELAAAAGLHLVGAARPDKWRRYLRLRRQGMPAHTAITKAGRLSPTTAARLEKLV